MFTHFRTQGIVLDKVDRGEADRIFTIFTKNFGKLKILGKAIRKIKSKLRGGIETFYLTEVEFIQGKIYKTLTDTFLINNFHNLRKSLARTRIGFKISEVLSGFLKGEEKDERIWELLKLTLEKLNDPRTSTPLIWYYYFLWNLFSILGYRPELNSCIVCQKKLITAKLYFNSERGGIVCQSCFSKSKEGKEINLDTVRILRIIVNKDTSTLKRLKIQKRHLVLLENVSDYFLHSLQFS